MEPARRAPDRRLWFSFCDGVITPHRRNWFLLQSDLGNDGRDLIADVSRFSPGWMDWAPLFRHRAFYRRHCLYCCI